MPWKEKTRRENVNKRFSVMGMKLITIRALYLTFFIYKG
jgi:hypothetical protein